MEININLNNQRDKKRSKKVYRILAGITLILSISTAALLIFDLKSSRVILWFYMFYFLIFTVSLYTQSNGKHIFDLIGKSYFNIDQNGFTCKLDMFSKKVIKHRWNNIADIKIKLFEVQVKVKQQWETINLEKLSDDNLKYVKQVFSDYQQKHNEEKVLVA